MKQAEREIEQALDNITTESKNSIRGHFDPAQGNGDVNKLDETFNQQVRKDSLSPDASRTEDKLVAVEAAYELA